MQEVQVSDVLHTMDTAKKVVDDGILDLSTVLKHVANLVYRCSSVPVQDGVVHATIGTSKGKILVRHVVVHAARISARMVLSFEFVFEVRHHRSFVKLV